jgi:hypothetical protein
MPMTTAEVNHLRRLLAWMRCEWMLDEDMQKGFVTGALEAVSLGFATQERVGDLLAERATQINKCPAYVRQAVQGLTKALRAHEKSAGVIESSSTGEASPSKQLEGSQ